MAVTKGYVGKYRFYGCENCGSCSGLIVMAPCVFYTQLPSGVICTVTWELGSVILLLKLFFEPNAIMVIFYSPALHLR